MPNIILNKRWWWWRYWWRRWRRKRGEEEQETRFEVWETWDQIPAPNLIAGTVPNFWLKYSPNRVVVRARGSVYRGPGRSACHWAETIHLSSPFTYHRAPAFSRGARVRGRHRCERETWRVRLIWSLITNIRIKNVEKNSRRKIKM